MMGLSGELVTLDRGMLPLEDIAVGLSRIPRFAGQTMVRWSVVDHLLGGMVYASTSGWSKRLQLLFGIHDAHEAMTSDVPTTFKTNSLRDIQRKLDLRLFAALGIDLPTWGERDIVHELDGDMLLAEAATVCPPKTYARIIVERDHQEADLPHRVAVQEVLSWDLAPWESAERWLAEIQTLREGR
jgi:hypothetical protein